MDISLADGRNTGFFSTCARNQPLSSRSTPCALASDATLPLLAGHALVALAARGCLFPLCVSPPLFPSYWCVSLLGFACPGMGWQVGRMGFPGPACVLVAPACCLWRCWRCLSAQRIRVCPYTRTHKTPCQLPTRHLEYWTWPCAGCFGSHRSLTTCSLRTLMTRGRRSIWTAKHWLPGGVHSWCRRHRRRHPRSTNRQ